MTEEMTFEQVLERDGCLAFTNKGVSMMPLLREGKDVMLITKKGPERCRKLEAVLFRRDGEKRRDAYVMHRILKVNNDGTYWIVGDNCVSGETVREDQVLGILTGVIRDGKQVSFSSIPYRLYVNTWCRWYRLRFMILRARHAAGRALRRIGKSEK